MNDILELIKSRRNIKEFLPRYVSWEKISRIIDAGRHAPSCGNIQNWKFIVVLNIDKKKDVAESCYEQFEIIQASALIVICSEPNKAERYYGLRGERLYNVQNSAAAIENMILEAQSLGLGTRWIGGFDEEGLKLTLGIPEEIRPQAIIAVGYPKHIPQKPPKYPLENLVYFNGWGNKQRDPAKYANDLATIMGRKFSAAGEAIKETGQVVKEKSQEIISKNFSKESVEKNKDNEDNNEEL